MAEDGKIRVGISQGDINGVGLEVIIKSLIDATILDICTPLIFSSSKTISYHKKAIELNDFNFTSIRDAKSIIPGKINVVNCYEEELPFELGTGTEISGRYAFSSLEKASAALKEDQIDVLVTAPVNKNIVKLSQPNFIGHTEYLDQQFGQDKSLMLMVSESMKVAVVTGHIPLSQVAGLISTEIIIRKTEILIQSLKQDFGISKPKIAILGLNPHAGDNGAIGKEDAEIILPAVKYFEEKNILVYGPYSPDAFFGSGNYRNFDAVLAMYHDQGLIPFKASSFGTGVNFTAGLPVVRTSPDHGTAFDIAGKNKASEESFRNAIYLACDIYKNRTLYNKISSNPLKASPSKHDKFA